MGSALEGRNLLRRSSPTCFWSSLINLILNDTIIFFYLSCIISGFNGKMAKTCNVKPNGANSYFRDDAIEKRGKNEIVELLFL